MSLSEVALNTTLMPESVAEQAGTLGLVDAAKLQLDPQFRDRYPELNKQDLEEVREQRKKREVLAKAAAAILTVQDENTHLLDRKAQFDPDYVAPSKTREEVRNELLQNMLGGDGFYVIHAMFDSNFVDRNNPWFERNMDPTHRKLFIKVAPYIKSFIESMPQDQQGKYRDTLNLVSLQLEVVAKGRLSEKDSGGKHEYADATTEAMLALLEMNKTKAYECLESFLSNDSVEIVDKLEVIYTLPIEFTGDVSNVLSALRESSKKLAKGKQGEVGEMQRAVLKRLKEKTFIGLDPDSSVAYKSGSYDTKKARDLTQSERVQVQERHISNIKSLLLRGDYGGNKQLAVDALVLAREFSGYSRTRSGERNPIFNYYDTKVESMSPSVMRALKQYIEGFHTPKVDDFRIQGSEISKLLAQADLLRLPNLYPEDKKAFVAYLMGEGLQLLFGRFDNEFPYREDQKQAVLYLKTMLEIRSLVAKKDRPDPVSKYTVRNIDKFDVDLRREVQRLLTKLGIV